MYVNYTYVRTRECVYSCLWIIYACMRVGHRRSHVSETVQAICATYIARLMHVKCFCFNIHMHAYVDIHIMFAY